MQRELFAWLIVAFFLFSVHCAASEEESYTCKRLVQESYRCKVYNYRHPLCKKWDHSQCPPPRVIRDYSQCVSYACTRKTRKKNPQWPVQTATPTPSPPTSTKVILSQESRLSSQESTQEESLKTIKTLQDAIADLRRVISCQKIFVIHF